MSILKEHDEIEQAKQHINSCQIELALLHKRLIELNEEVAEKIAEDESEETVEEATELFHKITDLVKNIRFQERILKDRTSALSIALMSQEVNKPTTKTLEKYQWFSKDKLQDYALELAKDKTPENIKYIKRMIDGNVHLKPLVKIENESVFEELVVRFPNFEEVTRFYQSQFRLARLTGNIRIMPTILLGAPGIGKTKYAKALAEILKTGFMSVDMASLTGPWILTGNNSTWQNAKQGKFLEAMVKSPTASPIFLLDELDKASKDSRHDTMGCLYQILESETATEFRDEYVDFEFDMSGLIVIASANSTDRLSEPLLSRFRTFEIPSPTDEQLDYIIRNIYIEATRDTFVFEESISQDKIDSLKNLSLREIKNSINNAVAKTLLTVESVDKLLESGEKLGITDEGFPKVVKKHKMGF